MRSSGKQFELMELKTGEQSQSMSVEGQSSNAIRGGTLFSILISSKVTGLESKTINLSWQS